MTYQYNPVYFATKNCARRVLDNMRDIAHIYGLVTVADMQELSNLKPTYTDNKFGWIESMVRGASIIKMGENYIIDICKPVEISSEKECDKDLRKMLKPGNVVKLRNGQFRMVMPVGNNDALILTEGKDWNYISAWNENLDCVYYRNALGYPSKKSNDYARGMDMVAVYGFTQGSKNYRDVGNIDDANRPLLWERKEPEVKKMTVSDIIAELGYEVEIVAEVTHD